MLDAFLEENPDATEEDLYLALGSPEELAEQMMEECVFNEGKNSLNKHLNKITITSVVLGVALLFLSITAYCYFTINIKTEIIKKVKTQEKSLYKLHCEGYDRKCKGVCKRSYICI